MIAHSDKDQATATWKKSFGFYPLAVFADHGLAGSGEPLTVMLRPGNAGSDAATDHIEATRLGLAQLPTALRRQVLIRTDSAGAPRNSWAGSPSPAEGFSTPSGSP